MGFKKMTKNLYPPRLWSLVGYPGHGKSTFASQMRGPMLVVDADHRFSEVMELAKDDIYELSNSPADNVDPDRITRLLAENMPGSDVKTIVVDSLTAIITPLVVQAMVDHDAKRAKNLAAAFKTKALAMRQIQDGVTRWGVDALWIYHRQDARDGRGKEVQGGRTSISQTELARLRRCLNMELELVVNAQGQRGIRVNWARRGRSGMVIPDETGTWQGMPEKIERAVYDGLSKTDQDKIEAEAGTDVPEVFESAEAAWAWGVEQGAFGDLNTSSESYDQVKKEFKPKSAQEMAAYWISEVLRMVEAQKEGGKLNGVTPPPSEEPVDATPF